PGGPGAGRGGRAGRRPAEPGRGGRGDRHRGAGRDRPLGSGSRAGHRRADHRRVGAGRGEVLGARRRHGRRGPGGRPGGGRGAVPVPGSDVAAPPRTVIDPTLPIADLTLAGVTVPAERVLVAPGTPGVEEALERAGQEATVALATMVAGACRAIFEQTVEYAK